MPLTTTYPSSTWVSTTTYANGNLVNYAGLEYKSQSDGNVGNIPPNVPAKWALNTDWNSGVGYSLGDKRSYNGLGYISLANSNTNHIPSSTKGTWWDQLIVRYARTPPPSAAAKVNSFTTIFFTPAIRQAIPLLSEPGAPAHMGHVDTIFYRQFPSNRMTGPGPSSVWIGRLTFRIPKSGWFFGLGQRANKTPVMHNLGE